MALPGPMSCSKKSDVFESAEHDTFLFTTYIKPRAKIRPPIWTMDFSTSTQCNRRWRDSREQSLWRHTQIHLTNGTLVAHDVRQDASFDVQLCVKMMEELRQRQMMCRDASRFCQMATVHLPTQNLLSRSPRWREMEATCAKTFLSPVHAQSPTTPVTTSISWRMFMHVCFTQAETFWSLLLGSQQPKDNAAASDGDVREQSPPVRVGTTA